MKTENTAQVNEHLIEDLRKSSRRALWLSIIALVATVIRLVIKICQ